jgi:hypothetical protein
MKEARRFLRYVLPGLVLLIEVCLYLWISSYHQFVQLIKEFGKDVAFPVSVFFASGGIGYLLSLIYHVLYWATGIRELVAVDHRPLIKDAVNRKWLKLQRRGDEGEVNVKELTQAGAWCIVTSFWHERKESSKRIKGANSRIDSLSDITHGLGTTVIGSIIAIPLWQCAHNRLLTKLSCICFCSCWDSCIITLILALSLVSCQACHAGRDPASKTAWIPACAGMTILGHTTSYG